MATRLTDHFTYEELIASTKAKELKINNTPDAATAAKLGVFAVCALEPLRQRFGKGIYVSSGWRCAALNKAVGGVTNSQHKTAEAADLQPVSGGIPELRRLFQCACEGDYDQVLYERRKNKDGSFTYWVHLSWKADGTNRHDYRDNYLAS